MNTLSWTRLALLGLALGVAACDDKESDDPIGDTDDTDDTVACTSAIGTTVPSLNSTDVFYRPLFVVNFTEPEEDKGTTFALTDAGGADVALGTVTWSADGKQATFEPAAPLAPSSQYTLAIDFSCDNDTPASLPFTTTATGVDVTPEDFLGATYGIDLSTATIVEPAGVNQILGGLLGQLEDVIAVVPFDLTEGELSFYGGLAEADGTQDVCQTTIAFPEAADFSENPFFQISAPDGIELSFEGIEISLLELELSGAFTPDASAIEGITLAGSVDTRTLIDILGDELGGASGDDAVCTLLGQLTGGLVACEACPGGGGNFCLSLVATNVKANLETWDLAEITQEDIDDNAECQPPAE